MKTYQHILVATDLSPASDALLEQASLLAKKENATLSLVHVLPYPPIIYGGEFVIAVDVDLENTLKAQAKEALAKQAQKLAVPAERQWLTIGSMTAEIVHLAQQQGVDLIIVGSHDRHGLASLLNSTADSILHAMPCDVLAIKIAS